MGPVAVEVWRPVREKEDILKDVADKLSDVADLTLGATYIPPLAGLGQSMTAMATVPVASALLGPVVGLASAKAVISHFR